MKKLDLNSISKIEIEYVYLNDDLSKAGHVVKITTSDKGDNLKQLAKNILKILEPEIIFIEQENTNAKIEKAFTLEGDTCVIKNHNTYPSAKLQTLEIIAKSKDHVQNIDHAQKIAEQLGYKKTEKKNESEEKGTPSNESRQKPVSVRRKTQQNDLKPIIATGLAILSIIGVGFSSIRNMFSTSSLTPQQTQSFSVKDVMPNPLKTPTSELVGAVNEDFSSIEKQLERRLISDYLQNKAEQAQKNQVQKNQRKAKQPQKKDKQYIKTQLINYYRNSTEQKQKEILEILKDAINDPNGNLEQNLKKLEKKLEEVDGNYLLIKPFIGKVTERLTERQVKIIIKELEKQIILPNPSVTEIGGARGR